MTKADLDRWHARLLPVLVILATLTAFAPVLANGWVGWDDPLHFLNNPFYRGLGPAQLRWMIGSPHFGLYFPVAWLTLGLDYCLWGMEASGYHLGNLLIHAAGALLLYFVALRLFAAGVPSSKDEDRRWAAAFAALAFAVHPLRVEAVAWISERREVLADTAYIGAVLLWLRSVDAPATVAVRRRIMALLAFAASLLSKPIGMTWPGVMLLLNIFPLARLPWDPRRWAGKREKAILLEIVPFAVLSAGSIVAAWAALAAHGNLSGLREYPVPPRLAQACYALFFYLWKTIAPFGLIALYEAPAVFRLTEPRFLCALLGAPLFFAGLWFSRRRLPVVAVAGAYYALTLAPVSGLVRNGLPYLAVDRYCQLASVGVAVALGAGFLAAARRRRGAALVAASTLLAAWGVLSWRQSRHWLDSKSLWGHALAVDPDNATARANFAAALAEDGDFNGALEHARRAVAARPDNALAQDALGAALLRTGDPRGAAAAFAAEVRLDPRSASAAARLGRALAASGAHAEAVDSFRRALALEDDAGTRLALGNSMLALGRTEDARSAYRAALALDPTLAPAHLNAGLLDARAGRFDSATAHYRLALRSPRDAAEAQYDWGSLLAGRGDQLGAIRHYREAVRLSPRLLEARFNMANALTRAGRFAEATKAYDDLLALDPAYAGARENRALARRLSGR